MKRMNRPVPVEVTRFLRDEAAATAIEYALIASVLSIAIAGSAMLLGETLRDDFFQKVANSFPSASP